MEKMKYEMPRVEVRDLESVNLFATSFPEMSDAPASDNVDNLSNKNVWDNLW